MDHVQQSFVFGELVLDGSAMTMPRSRLDLDCGGNREKIVGHLYWWINLPDVGERAVAEFGKIGDFGKVGVTNYSSNT